MAARRSPSLCETTFEASFTRLKPEADTRISPGLAMFVRRQSAFFSSSSSTASISLRRASKCSVAIYKQGMETERQLQLRVVQYLRDCYEWAPLIPGLGEHQSTPSRRVDAWAKGYLSGQPDLLVLAPSNGFCGLAIEFKSPSYRKKASASQLTFLGRLEEVSRFRTLVSNSFEEIVHIASNYLSPDEDEVPTPCLDDQFADG